MAQDDSPSKSPDTNAKPDANVAATEAETEAKADAERARQRADEKARAFWAEPTPAERRATLEAKRAKERQMRARDQTKRELDLANLSSDQREEIEAGWQQTSRYPDKANPLDTTPVAVSRAENPRGNPRGNPNGTPRGNSAEDIHDDGQTGAIEGPQGEQEHEHEPGFLGASPPRAQKSKQTSKRKPRRARVKRSLGQQLRRTFYALGTFIFVIAATIVVYFGTEPWLEAWLEDRAPDITLPSDDTLALMSTREREILAKDALRVARFRPQRVINEKLPTSIDSRPEEIGTFPLNKRDRRITVSGVVRHFRLPDGREFVRLTDFDITPGYKLMLALSPDPDPRSMDDLRQAGFLEFAELKGDVGPQNYLLPQTFKLSDFDSLVIFDSLFNTVYANARLN